MRQKHNKRRRIFVITLLLLFTLVMVSFFVGRYLFPKKYQDAVALASTEHDLPESLIYAVIHTESGFRADVDSYLNARGLMQLTEDTFDWVKYRKSDSETEYIDLYNPNINVHYGATLLELLTDEFGNTEAVLCAYHAGWGNVKNWLKNTEYSNDGITLDIIPFRDTAHYVYKVKRAQKIYQLLYQIS